MRSFIAPTCLARCWRGQIFAERIWPGQSCITQPCETRTSPAQSSMARIFRWLTWGSAGVVRMRPG